MSNLTLPPPAHAPGVNGVSLPALRRFSVDEFHRIIDAGVFTRNERSELIEGYIVTQMPHNPPHDGTILNIEKKLDRRLPSGWVTRAQSALTLQDSEPLPDIAVVRGDETSYFTRHPEPQDLGMLIEVAHATLSFDRNEKSRLYARAAVLIYWIVNLVDGIIEVYTQPSGPAPAPAYASRQDYGRGDSIPLIIDGKLITSLPVSDLLP